jgi:hypothetical protein
MFCLHRLAVLSSCVTDKILPWPIWLPFGLLTLSCRYSARAYCRRSSGLNAIQIFWKEQSTGVGLNLQPVWLARYPKNGRGLFLLQERLAPRKWNLVSMPMPFLVSFHGFELRSCMHCVRISSSKSSSVSLHSRACFFFINAGFSCVTPAPAAAKVRFYRCKLWCAFDALVTKCPK